MLTLVPCGGGSKSWETWPFLPRSLEPAEPSWVVLIRPHKDAGLPSCSHGIGTVG